MKYLACRGLTLMTLLLASLFLGYYIHLASLTDEFSCDLRTGALQNDSAVPSAVQCKLAAVSIFGLLSKINLGIYALLSPLVVYASLGPARQSSSFLQPYEILPGFGSLGVITPFYNDLSIYLLFLKENLSHLESFKCLQVGLDTDLDQVWWISCFCLIFNWCNLLPGAWAVSRSWGRGIRRPVPSSNAGPGEEWCDWQQGDVTENSQRNQEKSRMNPVIL